MKKYYLILILFLFLPGLVSAEEYPVPELGNCQSKEECRVYCDKLENLESCLEYGKKHQLLNEEKIVKAEIMAILGIKQGPGNCRTLSECRNYCNDFNHLEECFNFAKDNQLTAECEVEKINKMISTIKEGINPPNCFGKEDCLSYCLAPENLDQCLYFAQSAGLLTKEQALLIRKTGGKGPGQCQGEESCKLYCDDPAHMEECFNFAIDNGFITEEEKEEAFEIKALAEQGGPGQCQGIKECSEYCSKEENLKECLEFTFNSGIISEEEKEEAEKIIEEGGPGGCKNKKGCKNYCENVDNMKECIDFMLNQGYLSEEAVETIEKELEKAEELLENQIKEFQKEYQGEYDIDIDEEQIKKDLKEELQPYKEIIDKYKKRSSLKTTSRSIVQEFNVLKKRTKFITKSLENYKPNNLAGFLDSLSASATKMFLK